MSALDPVARAALNAPAPAASARDDRAALRRAAHQFEGVLLDQLFQAMRASVPEGGFLTRTEGEEMFTSMLDTRIAELAALRDTHGPGEALYRQMVRRLAPSGTQGTTDGGVQP